MLTIRVENLKDRVISRPEEAAILNAIEARRQKEPGRQWWRFAVLVRFLMDTGARLGEAVGVRMGITPEDITTRTVYIEGEPVLRHYVTFGRYRTKCGKPRTIPLTDAAAAGLDILSASNSAHPKIGNANRIGPANGMVNVLGANRAELGAGALQ